MQKREVEYLKKMDQIDNLLREKRMAQMQKKSVLGKLFEKANRLKNLSFKKDSVNQARFKNIQSPQFKASTGISQLMNITSSQFNTTT